MMRNVSDACSTFIVENSGDESVHTSEKFIPTRFPYTYAYDYIRTCVPGNLGRGEAGQLLTAWTNARGLDEEQRRELLVVFAMRYMKRYNVQV